MPPRRRLGRGYEGPEGGKGNNPASGNGKGKNPYTGGGKGNAPRRRNLGLGGGAYPQPESKAERAERLKNRGVTPHRSAAERALFGNNRTPTTINSQPEQTPAEIRDYIDQASANLSLETQYALRRADWYQDTSELLTIRPTNTSDNTRPRTLAAGYDSQSKTLFVRFRGPRLSPNTFADGVGYEYYGVTQTEWELFRDNWSPGRYINDALQSKPYTPSTW